VKKYLSEYCLKTITTLQSLELEKIMDAVLLLCDLKKNNGRLFILGVGGSAANASHAVNDFRKIANIEAYAATDNVSELTARTNDNGWQNVFSDWLACSRLTTNDLVMIFSVGAGSVTQNLSVNLIKALDYANNCQAKSITIAGRQQGYCMQHSTCSIHLSVSDNDFLTPISEAMQAVVWHAIVSHPALKQSEMTWENIKNDQ